MTISDRIYLEELSTLYVPYSYHENGTAHYLLGGGAAEQSSYDHVDQVMYVVGAEKINAVDISNVTSPRILYYQRIGHYDPTDVEVCGDHVFVALDNMDDREAGKVLVFKTFDRTVSTMELVLNITVGALPDMLHPTQDCKTVVIALEAEAYAKNNQIIDPEGGVGILKIRDTRNIKENYSYKRLNFTAFNDRWEELEKAGARFVYRDNNNTFAQDLEPEYVSYNEDESKAYICLQENNAIAEVNLQTEEIVAIHPLGYKHWNTSKFDASDRDNEINIRQWPVLGMYQPDSIHVIKHGGREYLVTANEGDAKDYSEYVAGGFNEETRVKDLSIQANSYIMEWAALNNMSDISADENIGRLKVTVTEGRDDVSGQYANLYAYGARSFSIWDLQTMELVFDSGSDVEDQIAKYEKVLFNADVHGSDSIPDTLDKRSDDKGPECESLAIAELGDRTIIFLGSERPGFISIYSIKNDITQVQFENIYSGVPTSSGSWNKAFEDRKLKYIDPEDLRYLPPSKSPNGKHMLVVAGATSGTLTLFNIRGTGLDIEDPRGTTSPFNDGSNGCGSIFGFGDFSIIQDRQLRGLLKKGPKYRIPSKIDFIKCREVLKEALDNYTKRWCKSEGVESHSLNDWKNLILDITDIRIDNFHKNPHLFENPSSRSERYFKSKLRILNPNYIQPIYVGLCLFNIIIQITGQAIYGYSCQKDIGKQLSDLQSRVQLLEYRLQTIDSRESQNVAARDCHAKWDRFQDSCYKHFQTKKSWGDAKAVCENSGTKLVEVETREEDIFLKKLVMSLPNQDDFWIGGTDQTEEGKWVWSKSNRPLTYTNWYPRQPDSTGGAEECLEIMPRYSYLWNDQYCQSKRSFICEDQLGAN
ncbi:hypothetical protein FSP39_009900 [Pinctada imbricata]|uniref:C-type lectin domain-containing protein n=1 Tax=Pinctada imbricata TaxID=66713 RepID=A0AA89BX59_PINIB|nr:hypothetical protein FSP39_009900 [Pinctada imbricata]